jgi:single-strand DNA-binding protein
VTGKRTETAGEKVTDNNIHRAKCLERMIMTMNKVILMGRLTKNPEIKYAGKDNDMAVARYMLAVNRRYKRDGEQEADFISCVTFGKSAEFAQKYLHKGMRIVIGGRISTGNYKDKDGKMIYTTDVIVESMNLLRTRTTAVVKTQLVHRKQIRTDLWKQQKVRSHLTNLE